VAKVADWSITGPSGIGSILALQGNLPAMSSNVGVNIWLVRPLHHPTDLAS